MYETVLVKSDFDVIGLDTGCYSRTLVNLGRSIDRLIERTNRTRISFIRQLIKKRHFLSCPSSLNERKENVFFSH